MRKQPFASSTNAPGANTPVATVPRKTLQESVVDISDILSAKTEEVKQNASSTAKEILNDEELDDDDTDLEDDAKGEPGAEPEEDATAPKFEKAEFEKFKQNTGKVLGDYVKDPKKVTKVMVKFSGMLRMLLYPFIYKMIIFETSDERKDCELTLKKITAAKKANQVAELNDYEQELMAKWNDFVACKNKIMLSDDEVELLSEILQEKVKEMPIAQWIEKYDWLFIVLYIESKRFIPVAGIRMKNNIMKDFTTD